MRIALLSTNMAPGGAETLVANLAIRLRKGGWDVDVISMLPPTAFVCELRDADVPLHAPGIWTIPALIRRLRPQVLHCHMFHANVLGRLLRLFMPFRGVISTVHSVAESKRSSGRIWHRDLAYRFTDRLADATVCVSQAVAERHQHAKAVRHPMVIPNGIDTGVYRPDAALRARVRSELGLGDEFVWLAAGRLMWKKNYPALLKALEAVGSGVLLIAGAGPQEAELRALAGKNVRFLGQREDMPALMNGVDGFVLSSVIEGLPLALLEAAATGLPCVATDAGGVRETGIGIVVRSEDLAIGMRQVMTMSASERAALGEAGRMRVQQAFSLDAVVTQWESLYRRIGGWT